jgi:acyl carrier protein
MSELMQKVPKTRPEFAAALLDFINVRLPQMRELKFSPEVDGATPLFESGPIDSLGILHLIEFVEKAIGRPIPTKLVTMRHFRTVDAICETFWTESPEDRR